MKNLLYILLMVFLSTGCGPENARNIDEVTLSVDRSVLEFTAEGGEQSVAVTSSAPFYLLPGESWVSVEKGTKTGNDTPVKITVAENASADARSTRVTISSGTEKAEVEISQEGTGVVPPQLELPENVTAMQMAEALGIGWNLGNHFDAYNDGIAGETAWGNPMATQATFDKVRAAGFTSVRIPITWLGKFGGAPAYKISEAWLDRIAEVVGYAEKAG